jgi:hypothetical protein
MAQLIAVTTAEKTPIRNSVASIQLGRMEMRAMSHNLGIYPP